MAIQFWRKLYRMGSERGLYFARNHENSSICWPAGTARKSLLPYTKKRMASLVVIRGRRRIGKSRLVEEFAKGKPFFSFTGLAPTDKTTAQLQRDEFAKQLGAQLGYEDFEKENSSDLLFLAKKTQTPGRQIVFFDEITWMGPL